MLRTKKNKVRRRRELLLLQVTFVCGALGLAWSIPALLSSLGLTTAASTEDQLVMKKWESRKLMAMENGTRNCTEPAIHEFPDDIFTNKERRQGGVLLHIFAALYMFFALAIVCDDYFVPSLEKICEKLHLSEDVAGATFMAAGSSAPELFASVIGVFITHGDVGIGTIVGSAVFNILCIIGICGIFAGQVIILTWWPLFRDSVYYTLSVIALIAFIYDERIFWWESLVLVIMYAGYILILKFNSSLQTFFTSKVRKNSANDTAMSSEMEDGNDPSVPLLFGVKISKTYSKNSVMMVDEIICASPPKFRFPEAGLRIMITKHFGPKTRLRMASRLIINERQRLIRTVNGVQKDQSVKRQNDVENGNISANKQGDESEADLSSPFAPPGFGDMAVSNTIGSNVFDILVGLGVPWGLKTLALDYGSFVQINSRGLVYSVVLLLGSVALTVLGVYFNKWRLDIKLGIYVFLLYVIFLCFSILIEYNIFTFINLPMCREDI
ncbi:sodium/potassium/calcium exchanger 4-like isoform X3 [Polypterus senegalus]|uniref:sodium/potassium/calcium exchanger 4-like isoform X3 n=1 Tax=Polypterus senegalus TaxID=55291 RepID=UPI0019657FDE|nr:sodium/potassium/calcium exchanger 4-like isoform X3 [Polypterus senegalus]